MLGIDRCSVYTGQINKDFQHGTLFNVQFIRDFDLDRFPCNTCKAKKKYMCVYCYTAKKSRVGRSGLIFFFYYRQNRK